MKKYFLVFLGLTLVLLSLVACEAKPAQDGSEPATEQVTMGPFATIPETPPIPADNPQTEEKIELGKLLYFEPRLSASGVISCHTCHNLSLGGTDRVPTSIGHGFQTGGRNAPTVLNAAFVTLQFWDGRAEGLEEQAMGPIQAEVEMALPADKAVEVIKGIEGYLPYFQAAFPEDEDPITFENIVKAISAFERTLITPNDPLDQYLRGDEDALSDLAVEGMNLFTAKGCASCHSGPVLSNGALIKFAHGDDPGRMNTTGDERDKFVFRVPTLRNLALTAPYFSDGSVPTLEAVVPIMAKVQLSVDLTPEEIEAMTAFLDSLVGDQPQIVIPILPPD
jgi:cytochrome c peroxidase